MWVLLFDMLPTTWLELGNKVLIMTPKTWNSLKFLHHIFFFKLTHNVSFQVYIIIDQNCVLCLYLHGNFPDKTNIPFLWPAFFSYLDLWLNNPTWHIIFSRSPFQYFIKLCTLKFFNYIPGPLHAKSLQSCPTLCDPMDCVACQAPLSIGFSMQEYWSGFQYSATSFSRGSFQPRDRTCVSSVSCTGKRALYH